MTQGLDEPRAAAAQAGPVELGELLEQLVQSRRWLRTVLDHLPAMVGYWDRDLRNRVANSAYVDWFGWTPEQLQGRHIRELLGEELYAKNLPYVQAALAGTTQHFDREIVDPTGTVRYSQAAYVPDVDAGGQVSGFFVLVTDVTERVRAERALAEEQVRTRRLADHLRIVSRTSARMHEWDPEDVQEGIADAVIELGYDASILAVIEHASGALTPSHGRGAFTALDGLVLPVGDGTTRDALLSGQPRVVPDYQQWPQAVGPVQATGVRTVVSLPVFCGNEVAAVLHVGTAEPRELAGTDLEVLSLLADLAGTALAGARRLADTRARSRRWELQAHTDALTGVGNRRAADDMLASAAEGDVVVLVDLDHFKGVNDRFGHAAGDRVLHLLATALREHLREGDLLARFGGEEFLLLLPGTPLPLADRVLQRLREAWTATAPLTTFSAGLARLGPDEDPQAVLSRADSALYRAKRAGRDRHVVDGLPG